MYDMYDGKDLVLSAFYVDRRIDDLLFRKFTENPGELPPDVLLISYRDSPYRFSLRFNNERWMPVVSWGEIIYPLSSL